MIGVQIGEPASEHSAAVAARAQVRVPPEGMEAEVGVRLSDGGDYWCAFFICRVSAWRHGGDCWCATRAALPDQSAVSESPLVRLAAT